MARTPFPVPFGWYQVGWPDELEPGGVVPLYLFDRDLVLWRDSESGAYHLQDAICPHLGGHLGHGGHVEGCEIQCPFHGWRFDAEGRNSDIPYSERVNRAARLCTYPVVERNGLVMAWYHPFEAEPMWEVPVVPEYADPDWSDTITRVIEIPAAWQEIAENSVDLAHFRYLHNTDSVPEARSYETDGPVARVRTVQKFVTPQGTVEGAIDIDMYGPGFSVIRFGGIVDTILLGCNSPVSTNSCEQRFSFRVRKFGDDATTSSVGEAFVAEVTQQIHEDLPIWRNKGYLTKPMLADTDGPYLKFRAWAAQFYAEGVEFDQAMYPPAPSSTSRPPAEGTVKLTASSRLKDEDRVRANMSPGA